MLCLLAPVERPAFTWNISLPLLSPTTRFTQEFCTMSTALSRTLSKRKERLSSSEEVTSEKKGGGVRESSLDEFSSPPRSHLSTDS